MKKIWNRLRTIHQDVGERWVFVSLPHPHQLTQNIFTWLWLISKFSNSQSPQNDNPKAARVPTFSDSPLSLSLSHAQTGLSFFLSIFFFFFFYFRHFPSKTDGHVTVLCLQGGGDCIQANGNSNGGGAHAPNSNTNQTSATTPSNDSLTMTEHQVAKLMEEDMGSAMQYLQGKGLCLMPISLATAISTATCHTRNVTVNVNPLINAAAAAQIPTAANPAGDGPSSPSMSVLTVQSAVAVNDGSAAVKDAASVSKP